MMEEALKVTNLLLLSQANVRMTFASKGGVVPTHIPAKFVTTMILKNTTPTKKYGHTVPGPDSAGQVGDAAFDEHITIWPGSFLTNAGVVTDVDEATNQLVRVITSIQSSDPTLAGWLTRFFGRLLGETMAHESCHALLPVAFDHDVDLVNNEIDTTDLMDAGDVPFVRRTHGHRGAKHFSD